MSRLTYKNFSFKQFMVPNLKKRLSFMLPAIFLMGFFVSILIEIGWGTDPASFMNLNIATALGWGLGNSEVLIYGIMLIFTVLFGVEMIGFGTLANMILIGYIIDFCRWAWLKTGLHEFIFYGSFGLKLAIFSITIICFSFVAAVYINAQMGVAPYDAVPNILSKWWPKIPFAIIRITFDLFAVVVGLIASKFIEGGIQGSLVGSIAMSLLLGPVISFVGKPLKRIL